MTTRVAILYSHPAPYLLACLRTLHETYGAEILAIFWEPETNAPFVFDTESYIAKRYRRQGLSTTQMVDILTSFCPDVIYVTGWMDRGYLRVARKFKIQGIPVVAGLDGQWRGTLRQWLAVSFGRFLLHKCIDILWVTGERQAQYARRLGFDAERLWYGFYCCDWQRFQQVYDARGERRSGGFLFVGRYVADKGLDLLLQAYERYRESVAEPMDLRCAGAGPLKPLLQGKPGVIDLGFVQADRLPEVFLSSSVFVLPSSHEPWGVVIQEATASGMVVICSNACGASVHLVQDQYNGFVFEVGNGEDLMARLIMAASLSNEEWATMVDAGHGLSRQFTPERWAKTLVRGIEEFKQ